MQIERSSPRPLMMSPTVGSITSWKSALGRTLSVMSISIELPSMAWGLCLRSNISFLRSRMFSVSAFCCGVSKVMKSARATFDLLESGRKKAESSSVVATMSIRTLLVARDGRAPRGEDPAVEEVVVVLGGVEHQHPPGLHRQRIGDIRQMLQIEVEIHDPRLPN